MSQSATFILLPQTVVQVNPTVIGSKQPAASYYTAGKTLQTVTWSLTNVTGILSVQATLSENPEETDWFTINNLVCTNMTQNGFVNLTGNFTWLRVVMSSFSVGVIQYVKVSY